MIDGRNEMKTNEERETAITRFTDIIAIWLNERVRKIKRNTSMRNVNR